MKKINVIFVSLSFFVFLSCAENSSNNSVKRTLIITPVCQKKKMYEILKDPKFDYPITYKVKRKKCIIKYEKKYIYVNQE